MPTRALMLIPLALVIACHGEGQEGVDTEGGVLDAGGDAGPSPEGGVDAGECMDAGDGGRCGTLLVDGLFNQCAKIGGYVFSPLSVAVGEQITISSFAEDAEGDPVTFRWSAPDGEFSHADAPDTTYRCASAGDKALALSVSDAPDCVAVAELQVRCLDAE